MVLIEITVILRARERARPNRYNARSNCVTLVLSGGSILSFGSTRKGQGPNA